MGELIDLRCLCKRWALDINSSNEITKPFFFGGYLAKVPLDDSQPLHLLRSVYY
jgi:hypothetical protein